MITITKLLEDETGKIISQKVYDLDGSAFKAQTSVHPQQQEAFMRFDLSGYAYGKLSAISVNHNGNVLFTFKEI